MNCEQTRENLVLHRCGTDGSREAQITALRHLRTCTACQVEYEALWHTATVLENVEAPVPPPGLAAQIQQGIQQLHQQRKPRGVASRLQRGLTQIANPLAWCFDRLQLDLPPQFVNAAALLFYVLASAFFVKLAFFAGAPEPELGLTAMEESRLRHVRMSRASWGMLKGADKAHTAAAQKSERAEKPADTAQRVNQFFGLDTVNLWIPRAVETSDTLQHEVQTADQKLTVFWNHIKTSL